MILYGTSTSRASRSLVALEELDLPYEHVPLIPRPGSVDRERLLTINPNGHIPVLDDDGLIVWESMAINLYLGDRYGGPLWPDDAAGRARTYQWSLWAQTEIDRADWNRARRSGDEPQVAADRQALVQALGVLDAQLGRAPWLLGDAISLADINVAATLSEPHERGLIGWQRLDAAGEGLSYLADWLARIGSRPSYARVLGLS
jgi:glutathione S-transferase